MNVQKLLYFMVPVLAIFLVHKTLGDIFNTLLSYNQFTQNAHRNPDLDDNITGIIQRHVGIHETHRVQTQDGYVLTIFRIPKTKPKGVILLQHPFICDARIWVSQYNESVAFFFWRAGYDVWLGNTRGNFFCKEHVSLKPTQRKFWNFTFHEMGYYDNHAIINYMSKYTNGSKIVYIGFSMGTTHGLIYTSLRVKESARFLKIMVLLAPVTHNRMGNSLAFSVVPPLVHLRNFFNYPDILSTVFRHDVWYLRALRVLYAVFRCRKCVIFLSETSTGKSSETDPDLVDMLVQVFGSEIPLKLIDHYKQIYWNRRFHMYDLGEEKNIEEYGSKQPPLYPIEKVKIPILLVYGQNDILSHPGDLEYLQSLLPTNPKNGKMIIERLNHMDFIYGRGRNEKLYANILKALDTV